MALATIVVFVVLFFVSRAVYRLWFSPLAHIPGPRIAGMQTRSRFESQLIESHSIDLVVLRIP
jgi:hypothetical protein